MGQGYTRNDTSNNIADGNVINASDLDGEFNAVDAAFNESSGHTHDGTADEGAPVTVLGPVQDFVASATEIKPKTSNTLDIGTTSLQFKDMYLDGTAYIDGLGEDILVATDKKVQFRDTALFINSSTDGQLDIAADTEVEITTALVEISADATVGDDLTLKSDAAVLGFGADTDVTLTHVADTGLLVNAAMVVQFRDSAINIGSPADGDLDINADDEIELNSTLIDINGNLDVSGTIVGASTLSATTGTFSGILKTDDATEATSTTDGSLQTDGGLSVVKDAVFGDDIKLLSDSAVIHFGADSDITLTHAADTSLATNGVMIATTFEPTGDTAAGDNAAIGYTAAEGLILTGQGSTSDITLKNDADATVFTVPTGTDDILFPDNAKAMFGASSDLQIHHDGTDSHIDVTGALTVDVSGDISLDAGGGEIYFQDDGTTIGYLSNSSTDLLLGVSTSDKDLYIQGNDGGSTINALHLDMSAAGLATFSAGASFAGTVDISNSSGATLKLTSTDTTGADTELLGQIDFVSSDSSGGSAGTQARIKGVYEDNGDSSGIAFLTGASTGSGTPTIAEVMRIRHEGNVGIGTTSPTRTLTVNSGATNTAFRLESTDAEVAMQFYDGTKTSTIQGGTSGLSFYPNTTVDKALAITATGKVETTNRDFGFFNHATTVSLADDASIVIDGNVAGCGLLAIYETASGSNAIYRVGFGSTAVLSGQGAVTITNGDTDGAVCVFSNGGHTLTIKNRVGATKTFSIAMFMAGNTFAG